MRIELQFVYLTKLGVEWDVTDKVLLSFGGQRTQFGFDDADMQDTNFNISSSAICVGGAYKFSEKVKLNIGYMHSFYGDHLVEGASGMQKMSDIMNSLREKAPEAFAGKRVVKVSDYKTSKTVDVASGEESDINLPKSNVLSYSLEDNSKVIIRPSGTEPKIKIYITACGNIRKESEEKTELISEDATMLLGV